MGLQEKKRWQRYKRFMFMGLGIKRWVVVMGLGAGILGMGVVYAILILQRQGIMPLTIYRLITLQFLPVFWRVLIPTLFGGGALLWGANRLSMSVAAPFRQPNDDIIDKLYDYSRRHKGKHIVVIGGGTGLSTLLRGLTKHTNNITAIVTVADDGGSSGRLRREFGMLPPGDIRNNMAALARDEALMTQLLQYRFSTPLDQTKTGSLGGHSFGNLLLAALVGITGSFDEALLAAERVLALRGRVMPATLDNIKLIADIRNPETGVLQRVEGESAIPEAIGKIEKVYLQPNHVRAYPSAIRAILQAELIVLGPGSLYTSVVPNLLIVDIASALHNSRAKKVYVCNIVNQAGETDNYALADYVAVVTQLLPDDTIDVVLANDKMPAFMTDSADSVQYVPLTPLKSETLITKDLINPQKQYRHDSQKLAKALMDLLEG
jgi:uncharacterized cofD-like protein